MHKPRDFVWSSEDRAEYAKWRRGVFVVYGCIGLVAIAVMVAIRLVGGQ